MEGYLAILLVCRMEDIYVKDFKSETDFDTFRTLENLSHLIVIFHRMKTIVLYRTFMYSVVFII